MLVVIAFDPQNPARQGQTVEVEDGIARLMIRDGVARQANPIASEPGPSLSPIVPRLRRGSDSTEGQQR